LKELSVVASNIQASTTVAVDTKFKAMKAAGINVIGFGAGEPDFATPDNIKLAGIKAIVENQTKYTAASGAADLKQAVCYRLKEDCGLSYEPSNVVVTSGAKHVVYVALRTLVNPGDEVILPAPYWVSYKELIQMVGGVPVIVHCKEEDGFKMTAQQLAAACTEKTKALILNNPSNPTGMMYSEEELRALAQVCQEKDLYVLSDEIYYKLLYDGRKFTSFASLSEDAKARTILVNGVSKSYAMTGWRIGYAAAPAHIVKIMSNFLSHSTSAASTISQVASVEALMGDQGTVEVMRQAFEQRRNHLVERLNAIDGVSCIVPEGAFYVMMNIEELVGKTLFGKEIRNADDFSALFLEKGLVAVVSCVGFDAPNFVRWSYATSMENIDGGLDRLEKFLKGIPTEG
jgi:aspartate aminotransferase